MRDDGYSPHGSGPAPIGPRNVQPQAAKKFDPACDFDVIAELLAGSRNG